MKPTAEQTCILTTVPSDTVTSYVIDAKAGSGKTSTMVMLAPDLPYGTRMIAFNKAIADELSRKLPSSIPASTFHSLGLSILRERLGRFQVDSRKLFRIAKELSLTNTTPYTNLVDMAKTSGIGLAGFDPATDVDAWRWLIDTYDMEIPDGETEESFIAKGQDILKRSIKDLKTVDFADMLYLPLYLRDKFGWTFDKYPLLVVDEAQDVSGLRLALIEALTDRVVAVGDPYQAIYGFAGAMNGALQSIVDKFDAQTLPLSISFRCGKKIIEEAQSIIDPANIYARANAHEGSVNFKDRLSISSLSNDTMTLCRTNAPLFGLAMRLLRARIPFDFRSDMPSALVRFIKKFKAGNIQQLLVRLDGWYETEIPRLESLKRKGAVAAAQEKYETLKFLISEHEDLEGVMSTLDRLLLSSNGPILSTIHKSKGLEAPIVNLIRPDLLPAPFASEGWQLEQERNLHYVAVTRAIDEFNYVRDVD